MRDFEEILKKYYESKSMPDERIEYLLSESGGRAKTSFVEYFAYAAIAVVLVFFSVIIYNSVQNRDLTGRVVAEIAMNHNKRLSVDVVTSDYGTLGEKMDKLDFPIRVPDQSFLDNYELIGGRYCSILGYFAAQLKVRSRKDGRILTLYVTKLNPELAKLYPDNYHHDNTEIRLWETDGILYGLASDFNPD
jgi:hypothetical protein